MSTMSTGWFNMQDAQSRFPVDKYGRPTTYVSFMVLKAMLSEPRRWFAPRELAECLATKQADVCLICRQLQEMGLVCKSLTEQEQYRYNLESNEGSELQLRLEKFLAEVEVENLPVHLTLDYSPSFRQPSCPAPLGPR